MSYVIPESLCNSCLSQEEAYDKFRERPLQEERGEKEERRQEKRKRETREERWIESLSDESLQGL